MYAWSHLSQFRAATKQVNFAAVSAQALPLLGYVVCNYADDVYCAAAISFSSFSFPSCLKYLERRRCRPAVHYDWFYVGA